MKVLRAALLLLVVTATTTAAASEKRIKEAEVPRAVLDAVHQKFPDMKAVRFEQEVEEGKTRYEVKLEGGKGSLELALSPDGKLLTKEKSITAEEIPESVKKGLQASKYAKWKIEKAEQVTDMANEKEPGVELTVSQGKQRHEVLFGFDGSIKNDETLRPARHD